MKLIALDTETTLIPGRGTSKINTSAPVPDLVVTALAWEDGEELFSYEDDRLLGVLEDTGNIWALHNVAFDFGVLVKAYGLRALNALRRAVSENRVYDTRVLYLLRDPDPPHRRITLQYLARRILRKELSKGDVRTSFTRGVPLSPEQRAYALEDAKVTLEVCRALRRMPLGSIRRGKGAAKQIVAASSAAPELHPDNLYSAAAAHQAWALAPVGMKVDAGKLEDLYEELEDEITGLQNYLCSRGLARPVRQARATVRDEDDSPPASRVWQPVPGRTDLLERAWKGRRQTVPAKVVVTQEVVRELFRETAEDLGIDPPRSAKTGVVSTSRNDWNDHKEFLPEELKRFLEYQKARKYLTAFLEPLRQARADRVYPNYWIPGAATGRWACSKPNLQQVPRTKGIRGIYVPSSGSFYYADYPTLELYTLGHAMLQMGIKGPLLDALSSEDIHKTTAGLMFGIPEDEVTANQRQASKACFHADVDILTQKGWVKVSELTGREAVANYHPGDGGIDFHKPLAITTRRSEVVHFQGLNVDMRVTPDHRMLYRTNNRLRVSLAKDFLPSKVGGLEHAGRAGGRMYGSVDARAVRQAVCVQADGSYAHSRVRFGFSKPRKISRFEKLWGVCCTERRGVWSATVSRKGPWTHLLDENKEFRAEVLISLPLSLREVFLDELAHWDGTQYRKCTSSHYCTTSKRCVDAVQAVAAVSGRKTRVKWQTPAEAHHKPIAVVRVSRRSHSSKPVFCTHQLPEQQVFCLTTLSGFVIARDGGIPLVIGQCNFGLPGGMGTKRFQKHARLEGLDWTFEDAAKVRALWFATYWDVGLYLERFKVNAYKELKPPHMSTPEWLERLGFERWPSNFELCRTVEGGRYYTIVLPSGRIVPDRTYTEAANGMFQGLGADVITRAFNLAVGLDLRVVAVVHDSITVESKVDVSGLLSEVMKQALADVCPSVPVPEIAVDRLERWK